MYTVNLKRIFIVSLFIAIPFMLSAQLTYGTTGLLHAPSAEMQKDKTVMLGANFMNKEITPPTWYYHTYNYYLNVTILPWMEVAYTCTLFKAEALGLKPYGYSGFTNQDRYFSLRLRALKEGQFWKYMPAVVALPILLPRPATELWLRRKVTDTSVVSTSQPPGMSN